MSRTLRSHEKDKQSRQISATLMGRGRDFSSEMLAEHSSAALKDEKVGYTERVVEFQAEARELHPCDEMEPLASLFWTEPPLISFLVDSAFLSSCLCLVSPGSIAQHCVPSHAPRNTRSFEGTPPPPHPVP